MTIVFIFVVVDLSRVVGEGRSCETIEEDALARMSAMRSQILVRLRKSVYSIASLIITGACLTRVRYGLLCYLWIMDK